MEANDKSPGHTIAHRRGKGCIDSANQGAFATKSPWNACARRRLRFANLGAGSEPQSAVRGGDAQGRTKVRIPLQVGRSGDRARTGPENTRFRKDTRLAALCQVAYAMDKLVSGRSIAFHQLSPLAIYTRADW